jgi:signal recognition particle receptor subunit beta
MALIDRDAGEIVIRLVYDGPPEAGKTTSLRALAGSLAQASHTPEEDAGGRTLWFDWMEYVGGRFEGCQIRCQIVSVPGQRALAARRRKILESADVVVFVGDSAARQLPETLAYLLELRELIGGRDVPVGAILQANKRDLPDAVPLDELRARVVEAGWPIGVVESIAAQGTGIREAFIYAVRLALDRVRELMQRQALASGGPRTADELLAALRLGEPVRPPRAIESGPGSVAAELFRAVLAQEADATRGAASPAPSGAPRPPDAGVPSGAIWPPVEGRAILAELALTARSPVEASPGTAPALRLRPDAWTVPRRLASGDWACGLGTGWRVVSSADATFASLDHGRAALIQWARLHASANGVISPSRCIVLADSGAGDWRLWQIVRAEPTLRELIDGALASDRAHAQLVDLAEQLIEADERLARTPLGLACTIDTIGAAGYLGLMPGPDAPLAPPRPPREPAALVRDQLGHALADAAISVEDVIADVARRAAPRAAMLG